MKKLKYKYEHKSIHIVFICLWIFSPKLAFADYISFVVPNVAIAAGDLITADKLEQKNFYISAQGAARYVLEKDQIIGKVSKRLLLPGRAVTLSSLTEPKVVFKGRAARLIYKSGDLVITALGMPLNDSSVGDWVKVRNMDSGRLVSGVVLPSGAIEVGKE